MRATTATPASEVTLWDAAIPELFRLAPSAWYFSKRAKPVVSTSRKSSAPLGMPLKAVLVGANSV